MTDPVKHEGAPRAQDAGDTPVREDEHWAGFPGAEEASSYPVIDRGRYKLLLFLTLLAFVATVIAIATGQSENLPQREVPSSPR